MELLQSFTNRDTNTMDVNKSKYQAKSCRFENEIHFLPRSFKKYQGQSRTCRIQIDLCPFSSVYFFNERGQGVTKICI